mmetsp:Transcript_32130/g.23732  ORF Transcript_32130/g.23732 Transcript_32130/m.23732 type:complete len:87 (+) Transcript_32130:73-333(+)
MHRVHMRDVIEQRGFHYMVGECTNSYSINLFWKDRDTISLYTFISYPDYEFEGQRPFKDVEFGEIWKGKPGVLGFVQDLKQLKAKL